jgi:hypothetical protein
VDDCVIDQNVFGGNDPRRELGIDPNICQLCKEKQCRGWKGYLLATYTAGDHPVILPISCVIQLDRRRIFDRGTAIAEFVGLVTRGIDGVDVMMGGTPERPYQGWKGYLLATYTAGDHPVILPISCVIQLDRRRITIAEFVGLVTRGIDGVDVMMGGTPERPYQVFQGQMGASSSRNPNNRP